MADNSKDESTHVSVSGELRSISDGRQMRLDYEQHSDILNNRGRLTQSDLRSSWQVFAALLYTDEDVSLASYVTQHFHSLDAMSGPDAIVYVVEDQPQPETNLHKLWQNVTELFWIPGKTIPFGDSNKTESRTKPFSKSEVYNIARQLNLYPDQIPCIVFFYDYAQNNKIIIPIPSENYASFFRVVFSEINRANEEIRQEHGRIGFGSNTPLSHLYFEAIRKRVESVTPTQTANNRTYYHIWGTNVYITQDTVQGDKLSGDKVGGDKIQTGDISGDEITIDGDAKASDDENDE